MSQAPVPAENTDAALADHKVEDIHADIDSKLRKEPGDFAYSKPAWSLVYILADLNSAVVAANEIQRSIRWQGMTGGGKRVESSGALHYDNFDDLTGACEVYYSNESSLIFWFVREGRTIATYYGTPIYTTPIPLPSPNVAYWQDI